MKKIIFVRHSKAEDPYLDLPDFERSLTFKGKNVSKLMARKLKETEKTLGILISSPAFRAIETALLFAGEYQIKPETIRMQSSIYFNFDSKALMEMLKSVDETVDTITLFGHNPSFTDLAGYLCKEACDVIPKTGVVSLSFNVRTWSEIKPSTGNADLVLKPKKVL